MKTVCVWVNVFISRKASKYNPMSVKIDVFSLFWHFHEHSTVIHFTFPLYVGFYLIIAVFSLSLLSHPSGELTLIPPTARISLEINQRSKIKGEKLSLNGPWHWLNTAPAPLWKLTKQTAALPKVDGWRFFGCCADVYLRRGQFVGLIIKDKVDYCAASDSTLELQFPTSFSRQVPESVLYSV